MRESFPENVGDGLRAVPHCNWMNGWRDEKSHRLFSTFLIDIPVNIVYMYTN